MPAVLDTSAPVTIIDGAETTRIRAPLTLFGLTMGADPIPRARFVSVPLLLSPLFGVGPGNADATPIHPISGVIGGDVLSLLAVRIDMAAGGVQFFPDIATSDTRFYEEGHAVIHTSPSGGGNFILEDGVVTFPPSRMVIGSCLDQRDGLPDTALPVADAVLVLATGADRLVLTESAYLRARQSSDDTFTGPLTFDTPYFLGGASAIYVHQGELSRIAFADDEEDTRGPCSELLMSRLMRIPTPNGGCPSSLAYCPCADENEEICDAGATVELEASFPVAVVRDSEPFLQALRDELRPRYADIDGLIGADVLRSLLVDVDYPHGRVILRCNGPGCTTTRRRTELPDP